MKKIPFLKLILPLIVIFFTLSCTFRHLRHELTIDDEVSQLILNAPSAESYLDAGIINLLDEDIVEVFKDGRCRQTLHMVFKILNERGKDSADIEIGYNSRAEIASIIYARTITAEGKILPLLENAIKVVTPFSSYPSYSDYKELTFSMPGGTVGSIIDYKVVIEEKKPEIEGKFSSRFYFQAYSPTFLCRYKVIAPEDMDLKYLVLNPLPDIQLSPKIICNGNKKIYLWEYNHIPQIIEENSMPPIGEVAFRILVTTMNSWEEFSYWWRKKIAGKTEPDESIKRKVAELTKNLSTSKEKMEVLFDYVKREIRYVSIGLGKSGYEPENAKKVFENKYGDCKDKSTLLISMLSVAGIPACYVLIPTNDMAHLIKDFPYPFQFNHCIVAVEKESDYHFIDPVGEDYRADYLPDYDQNRDVIIFNERESIFGRTSSARAKENAAYNQYRIKIATDGSIECEGRNFGLGDLEASLRAFYISNSPTEVREVLEKLVDKTSKGARLVEYSHSDPLNFKENFSVRMKFSAPDYCKKAGDMMICQLIPPKMGCPSAGKLERRYPLVINTNSFAEEEMELDVPENYEVYYLPEPMETLNQYFTFRLQSQRKGKSIFYRRELTRKATSITPEVYPAYRKFCQEMEKSFKKDVLFKAKETNQ